MDASGNFYIADSYNNRIRKVAVDGTITTIAGTSFYGFAGDHGPATSAWLRSPFGVAVDSSGCIYIADQSNHRIRKIVAGTITTVAGNGTGSYAGDGGPATSAELALPLGVVVDGSGNLYIADYGNCRIRKVNGGGIITTVIGNGGCAYSGDGGPAVSAQLEAPYGVALDATGNLYIADRSNQRVRKISTSGIIGTVAGGANGDLGTVQFGEFSYPLHRRYMPP